MDCEWSIASELWLCSNCGCGDGITVGPIPGIYAHQIGHCYCSH